MAKKKVKVLILSLLAVLVLGFLAFRAFENTAAYYYTISEAKAVSEQRQKLRIKGQLVEESINYDFSVPLLKFTLADEEETINAVYQGVLPDNFHHAQQLIIEGNFNSQQEFVVSKLMLQCPSKYEGEE